MNIIPKNNSDYKKSAISTIALLAALNAIPYLTASITGTNRPILNIDYAAVLLIASAGFLKSALLINAFFYLADVASLVTQIFPVPRISDLIYVLKFTLEASNYIYAIIAAIIVTLIFYTTIIYKAKKHLKTLPTLVIFNILIIFNILFFPGKSDNNFTIAYNRGGDEIVASISGNLTVMRSSPFLEAFAGESRGLIAGDKGATSFWHDELDSGNLQDKLLLIINESWGRPKNHAIQIKILEPIIDLNAFSIEYGITPSTGITLDGELRELCQLRATHYNLMNAKNDLSNCLPQLLKSKGYTTTAMHGATGNMYDRIHWYPFAGFDNKIFFENRISTSRCYSFPGACDHTLIKEVDNFFNSNGKHFFYWLTLNTHHPYDLRDLTKDSFDCKEFNIKESSESCRNFKLQAHFFKNLSMSIANSQRTDFEIIVAGDHAPIIVNQIEKLNNFIDGPVPWIRIRPKHKQ